MSVRCFMIQPFDGDEFDKRFDDVFAPAVSLRLSRSLWR